ncbi:MAG: hypothetical protein A2270_07660 [Elusimicrobia bacterium RIFOXYA12_FULL_51_18]|nr:MAG: hypothetical protein A2270_07660 [Elusimicrobia bacterium RIFOXYA12_FULL_51_18]OGS29941.1 MAG: hypothetical protein A2218_12330 [Elusimicrobia bacterium RIFOXYA2_FULL_53_38]
MRPKKKILLITTRLPFPVLSGGEKWAYNLAKLLSADHELYLFSFLTRGLEKYQAALALGPDGNFFKKIYYMNRPDDRAERGAALPILPGIYHSEEAFKVLRAITDEIKPDLAHILFFEMAQYEMALPSSLPLVYTEIDSSCFYPWKYFMRETAGLKGCFNIRELYRVRKYAGQHYRRFDAVTSISDPDSRNIAGFLKTPKIYYTPNAVLMDEFSDPEKRPRKYGRVLFTGHYPHFPNEDAGIKLATRIFPLLKKIIPEAELILAGSFPTEKIRRLAGPGVTVTGTLNDIRPWLWSAQVFAAPLYYGMGTKGKVLEAFAAGLPVVASRNVFEGIRGAVNGETMLLGGDYGAFASSLAALIKDRRLGEAISGRARVFAADNFGFEKVAATVRQVYQEALG